MWLSEAVGRVAALVMRVTAARSRGETRDLVIEHDIAGVTPEMIDWWWDHIDDSGRYALWHPGAHISFTWEVEKEGHVGRVHRVVERIGPFPVMLRIRWEETGAVPVPLEYGHVNTACTIDPAGRSLSWLVHQYEAAPGGTRMRSTFRVPARTPAWFESGLARHNREEMSAFTVFLPELYRREVST